MRGFQEVRATKRCYVGRGAVDANGARALDGMLKTLVRWWQHMLTTPMFPFTLGGK